MRWIHDGVIDWKNMSCWVLIGNSRARSRDLALLVLRSGFCRCCGSPSGDGLKRGPQEGRGGDGCPAQFGYKCVALCE